MSLHMSFNEFSMYYYRVFFPETSISILKNLFPLRFDHNNHFLVLKVVQCNEDFIQDTSVNV